MEIMKFFVYNPSPPKKDSNLNCNRCHIKTGSPYHTIDCYRQTERRDPKSYFQLSERVEELSLPKPRKQNRKYQQQLVPYRTKAHIFKQQNSISSRLEHLAAVKFRKCFAARQQYRDCPSVNRNVIMNLNMHLQRSMYNLYSRLENVKFPKIPDSPIRPAISVRPVSGYEDRLKIIEKLAQPKKILKPEKEEILIRKTRPIDMSLINKLSIPRQRNIKSSEENIKAERPPRGDNYYQKLSEPKKDFQAIEDAKRLENRKTGPIVRTANLAVQWKRLRRKKFRKGENLICFKVSPNALKYEASEKILKLAVPKTVESDANEPVAAKGKGGKKKK